MKSEWAYVLEEIRRKSMNRQINTFIPVDLQGKHLAFCLTLSLTDLIVALTHSCTVCTS